MIIERPRRRGYQLRAEGSPEAEALLIERGLTRPDLDHALAELARTEGIQVRTIVGINDDGVFGSRREGWRPDLPDAHAEPFIPVLWLQVLELLGRVPRGSTARFMENGALHGKPPTDGVFGPVQAAARVFIFQALSAWTVLEATGQTGQLAPDFESWLRKIVEDEIPYVRSIASVKASFPKH